MTTGDGGMMSTNQPDLIEPMRANRWVGIDKDTWKRAAHYTADQETDTRHWYYEIAVLGTGYQHERSHGRHRPGAAQEAGPHEPAQGQIIARYLNGIRDCRRVRPLQPYHLEDSGYWIFGVRCEDRDALILHLKKRGIATGVHYMPLPMHPLFKQHQEPIPAARKVWESVLTLPLFADLTDAEVDYVLEGLRDFDRNPG